MKRKNIKRCIREKINNYLATITDINLRDKMKKDIIVTGGSIASMLLNEEVKDYDIYFKTRETTLSVAQYYCELAKTNEITKVEVLHKELEFIQSILKIDIETTTAKVKEILKTQVVGEDDDALTIDSPLAEFGFMSEDLSYNGNHLSLRLLHNIYHTFNKDEDRVKVYSFGSFGTVGNIDSEKIDSQEVEDEENGKYEIKFISANAITLSDKIQLVIRFYGTPEEIHKNFDFVHATGVYDYKENELYTTTEQLESLLSKSLIYKGSLYPLASIFRARKFITRGWSIDAGQYLKMAFQLNELNLLDPYTLEEQLTGVDLLYFYQIISDLKYRQLTNEDFAPSTNYFISIIEKIFE
jgi:hypothetical protein